MSQQLDQINGDIGKINNKYSLITQFLNLELGYNFSALVDTSNKKNISPAEFKKAATLLNKNPSEAEAYLTKDLNFTSAEIQSVRHLKNENSK